MPATAHKQSRCEPPLAHPSRWPEQQKSPAQEACMQHTGRLKSLPRSTKVLPAPREREVTCKPLCQHLCWKMLVFPCERRSQARSSWERRGVLAAKLAGFPLSHPKCFPATGRTGQVPPAGRSWGTVAGLQHPPRDPCPASFHSFQAMIWHRQVPAASPKPGFNTLPQIVFLLLQTAAGTAQWAAWLSLSTKCTADALC